MEFLIGHRDHEYVSVQILRRSHASAADSADGNWLDMRASLAVGGFSGTVESQLRAEDIQGFADRLHVLERERGGEAVLSTFEGRLIVEITGDGKGNFVVRGRASDLPGTDNDLNFKMYLEQSFLSDTLRGLEGVLRSFPPK